MSPQLSESELKEVIQKMYESLAVIKVHAYSMRSETPEKQKAIERLKAITNEAFELLEVLEK